MKRAYLKILTFPLLLLAFISGAQGPGYEIQGKIEGAEGVKFLLQRQVNRTIITFDSAIVKNGIFNMKGQVELPEQIRLVAPDARKNVPFWIENSVISITGKLDSLEKSIIKGSNTHYEFLTLVNSMSTFSQRLEQMTRAFTEQREALMAEARKHQLEFVKSHPKSYVTPIILQSLANEMSQGEMGVIIDNLDPSISNTQMIKDLKVKMGAIESVAIGKKAPDFTLWDQDGKPVSLHSKLGKKLLLVDFWAGWCAPCRAENPNLVKVHQEFRASGFDILGVSLDRTKDQWLKAITDDKLTWTQVSDLSYFNSIAAKLYNVTSIPANFLLDEKGVIVATNLRGDALRAKVAELLGKK